MVMKRQRSSLPAKAPMPAYDPPYTLPEEDPFNIVPRLQQPRRRRSSMLDKWIQEQQLQHSPGPGDDDDDDLFTRPRDRVASAAGTRPSTDATRLSPYLAYPELRARQPPSRNGSAVTITSYDFVDDEDIPVPEEEASICRREETPRTPRGTLASQRSPFRSLNLPFRSSNSQAPSPSTSRSGTPSRMSFLNLPSRRHPPANPSKQHNRASSLGTLHIPGSSPRQPSPLHASASPPSKWRPSVLGYFSASAGPSQTTFPHPHPPPESPCPPPRPSISSSHTATSGTIVANEAENVSSGSATLKPPSLLDSVRSANRPRANTSRSVSDDVISTPASTVYEDALDELDVPTSPVSTSRRSTSRDKRKDSHHHHRTPFAPKLIPDPNIDYGDENPSVPSVAFASKHHGTLPKVSFHLNPRHQKKKKLVISGIGPNEPRKFNNVKRWCESFGEVNQIIRMPNGDLHVHFKSADVADTVCRLRAKVYIAGVGSVNLSWYTGHRP